MFDKVHIIVKTENLNNLEQSPGGTDDKSLVRFELVYKLNSGSTYSKLPVYDAITGEQTTLSHLFDVEIDTSNISRTSGIAEGDWLFIRYRYNTTTPGSNVLKLSEEKMGYIKLVGVKNIALTVDNDTWCNGVKITS